MFVTFIRVVRLVRDLVAEGRRALVFSKLLLNTLGPLAQTPTVSAQQYQQWTQDMARLEQSFGYPPGSLRGKGGDSEGGGPRLFAEEDLRAGILQRLRLLRLDRLSKFWRRHQPSQAQAGRENFARRPRIDNPLRVE